MDNANTVDSDEELVRAVVDDYVSGTYEADIEKLRGTFNDKASMHGFLDGQLIEATPEPFLEDVGSKPSLRESGAPYKATIESVHVIGNVASVVLRETGFGPFSFTDYFHLLKKDGKWQIVSKTFTTE
jgi:hypothetical protein